MRKSMSVNQLWFNAGILFISAFALKQFIWYKASSQVSQIRKEDNDIAQQSLENARKEGKKYYLPPLTIEQQRKLQNLTKEEQSMFLMTDQDIAELDKKK